MQFGGRVIIDPSEEIGVPGLRIEAVQLGDVNQSEYRGGTAAPSPPRSEPANGHAILPARV
jgi:hypothetical protein